MRWLKLIIQKYLEELNNEAPVSQDDIEYRANKMIDDIQKTLNARKDFKEEN